MLHHFAYAQYCIPPLQNNSCQSLYIANVNFDAINNSSVCAAGGCTYYNTPVPDIVPKQAYNLNVQALRNGMGNPGDSIYLSAWIDYNRDSVFGPG